MNLKKEMLSAVIFLAASIIFLSSATIANDVFAQTEGEEEESTSASTNYENFQNCLSDASDQYTAPTGDQIVNCFVQSGYVQGSSSTSTSNAADSENENENTQVSVVDDENQDDQTENVQVNVVGDEDDHDDHEDDHDDPDEDEDEE